MENKKRKQTDERQRNPNSITKDFVGCRALALSVF